MCTFNYPIQFIPHPRLFIPHCAPSLYLSLSRCSSCSPNPTPLLSTHTNALMHRQKERTKRKGSESEGRSAWDVRLGRKKKPTRNDIFVSHVYALGVKGANALVASRGTVKKRSRMPSQVPGFHLPEMSVDSYVTRAHNLTLVMWREKKLHILSNSGLLDQPCHSPPSVYRPSPPSPPPNPSSLAPVITILHSLLSKICMTRRL